MNDYIEYLDEKRPFAILSLFVFLIIDLVLIMTSLFIDSWFFPVFIFNLILLSLFLTTLVPEIIKVKHEKENVKKIIDSIKNGKSLIEKDTFSSTSDLRIEKIAVIQGEYNICVKDFYCYGRKYKIAQTNDKDANTKRLGLFESIVLFNFLYE